MTNLPSARISTRPSPLALGLAVVLLDQATKILARVFLPLCEASGCPTVKLFAVLELARVGNAGSALGFAQGLWVWTLIAAAGLAGGLLLARGSSDRMVVLGAALLAGGGMANLADRLLVGAVTDFISGGPVLFNLADVALALGALAMSFGLHRSMRTTTATEGGGSRC
jgi:signal peptidase II